jgi:hypothetical protein
LSALSKDSSGSTMTVVTRVPLRPVDWVNA